MRARCKQGRAEHARSRAARDPDSLHGQQPWRALPIYKARTQPRTAVHQPWLLRRQHVRHIPVSISTRTVHTAGAGRTAPPAAQNALGCHPSAAPSPQHPGEGGGPCTPGCQTVVWSSEHGRTITPFTQGGHCMECGAICGNNQLIINQAAHPGANP